MTASEAAFSAAMQALLGERGWNTDSSDLATAGYDWLGRIGATPMGIARPSSTAEVAAVVRLCRKHDVSITARGGNTGLNGGSILSASQLGILLSLSRMNRILAIDSMDCTATVEAGVVLSALHERLADEDLAFPLHLGSEGSAQIGGLVATNAGGSHAHRHGMMQDLVLGLDVVLPDGDIWQGCRSLLKDNAGYQLRRLFCGSEGTLGIVTKVALRLMPAAVSRACALVAVSDMMAAVTVGAKLRRAAGEVLNAIEFFGPTGLNLALQHMPDLAWPLAGPLPEPNGVCLLIELSTSSGQIDLEALLEECLSSCFETGLVLDGAVAASESQRHAFWRLREEMPEGQRREGRQIKHDVSVPVSGLPAFIAEGVAAVAAVLPGVRANLFGHLGDGNVHFNLSPPIGSVGFAGREAELSEAVYEVTGRHHGSIAAEHGLGQFKVAVADRYRPAPERRLMLLIKKALDPDGLFNPGKVM